MKWAKQESWKASEEDTVAFEDCRNNGIKWLCSLSPREDGKTELILKRRRRRGGRRRGREEGVVTRRRQQQNSGRKLLSEEGGVISSQPRYQSLCRGSLDNTK